MASKSAPRDAADIELRPDGWERFEKAVDAALHTKPKHREKDDKSVVKDTRKR
jgi:hypothetical protein